MTEKISMIELSPDERDLLEWLSHEDFSQYGECHGPELTALITKGLAQHHPGTGYDNPFIAKGRGIMFEAVSITEKGRKALGWREPLEVKGVSRIADNPNALLLSDEPTDDELLSIHEYLEDWKL